METLNYSVPISAGLERALLTAHPVPVEPTLVDSGIKGGLIPVNSISATPIKPAFNIKTIEVVFGIVVFAAVLLVIHNHMASRKREENED